MSAMKAQMPQILYNVGTGIRTSLKELAERVIELTECSKPISYAPRATTLVRNRIGCPKKALTKFPILPKLSYAGLAH